MKNSWKKENNIKRENRKKRPKRRKEKQILIKRKNGGNRDKEKMGRKERKREAK